jgi:hypothetical protein
MQALNFPSFQFKFSPDEQRKLIYDIIRKKYVSLTPEEWVRQHVIHYLAEHLRYPLGFLSVEKMLKVNGLAKRTDIVAYIASGTPKLIVECKAPRIQINQQVFDQIARYNITMQVPFLLVTNGLNHFVCKIDLVTKKYTFIDTIPPYHKLLTL